MSCVLSSHPAWGIVHQARVWDAALGKLVATFAHAGAEVVTLVFLEPSPLLLTCDSDGASAAARLWVCAVCTACAVFWCVPHALHCDTAPRWMCAGNNYLWGLDASVGVRYGLLLCWKQAPQHFVPSSPSAAGGASEGKEESSGGRELQASYATQAYWVDATHTLYVGDFAGQLTSWSLAAALKAVREVGGRAGAGVTMARGATLAVGEAASKLSAETMARRSAARAAEVAPPLLSGPALMSCNWAVVSHSDCVTALQVRW